MLSLTMGNGTNITDSKTRERSNEGRIIQTDQSTLGNIKPVRETAHEKT